VSRGALRFWGSALLLALGFSAATALLLPYDALRLTTQPDRLQAWLLTLWTGGVMAVLWGASGLLGFRGPLGFREIHEAGSFAEARERRRLAHRDAPGFYQNFAWWLICTGVILIGVYFLVWGSDFHYAL
jgi:hypothetical protein